MKKKIQRFIIRLFFKKPIRKFFDSRITGKDEAFEYLNEILYSDECRMIGSREGLLGYYDIDIEINRLIQTEMQKYLKETE